MLSMIIDVLYEASQAWRILFFGMIMSIYQSIFGNGNRKVPPVEDNVLLIPASKLARMIATRKVTCESVMEKYIDRVEEVNPKINAMAMDYFEDALVKAKEVDEMVKKCKDVEALLKEKPLLGVPFTHKEIMEKIGGCGCCGTLSLKDTKFTKDAPHIKHMINAGAIALCSSTVPEGSMAKENANKVHGRCNNPFDTAKTPGGSSGGEGALLGAAASLIGLGNDIAGSIRTPSAWCGIFGHKPTQGIIKTRAPGALTDFATVGPMVRYAEDLLPALKVLSNNEPKLKLDEEVILDNVKIYYCEEFGSKYFTRFASEVSTAVKTTAEALEERFDVDITETKITDHSNLMNVYLAKLKKENAPSLLSLVYPEPFDYRAEVWKKPFGQSQVTAPSIHLACLEQDYGNKASTIEQDVKVLEEIKKRLEDILDDDSVLLIPPQITTAPHHHGTHMALADYWAVPGLFNLLNLPVTVAPVGLSSEGMPLSVGIVGKQFNDRLTIKIAMEIQEEFGGWNKLFGVE